MVEIQPIRVELEREEDGRILAFVPDLPGVMAYGANHDEAMRKVKSIALALVARQVHARRRLASGWRWVQPPKACSGW